MGETGEAGPAGPRFATRTLFRSATTAPDAPSATFTWSNGTLNSITSDWSETAPTQVATASTSVYFSNLTFTDISGAATSTTTTGSTPTQATSFSGIVSFSDGNFAIDGSDITTINGGNIATGTITADEIAADAITADR